MLAEIKSEYEVKVSAKRHIIRSILNCAVFVKLVVIKIIAARNGKKAADLAPCHSALLVPNAKIGGVRSKVKAKKNSRRFSPRKVVLLLNIAAASAPNDKL